MQFLTFYVFIAAPPALKQGRGIPISISFATSSPGCLSRLLLAGCSWSKTTSPQPAAGTCESSSHRLNHAGETLRSPLACNCRKSPKLLGRSTFYYSLRPPPGKMPCGVINGVVRQQAGREPSPRPASSAASEQTRAMPSDTAPLRRRSRGSKRT